MKLFVLRRSRLRWRFRQLEGIRLTGGKKGSKRSILVDEKGVPLAIILSGANIHDSKLLDETLRSIVISRAESVVENLCLDAGYVGTEETIKEYGYIAHIRPILCSEEEKQE